MSVVADAPIAPAKVDLTPGLEPFVDDLMELRDRLRLQRPLVIFDLETSNLKPADKNRIVQIGLIKLYPRNERFPAPLTARAWKSLINPTEPIDRDATAKHGITEDMVKDAPTFASQARVLHAGFSASDWCGFNINGFDVKVLKAEFARTDTPLDLAGIRRLDAFGLYKRKNPKTLGDVYQALMGEPMPFQAHDAMGDVFGTVRITAQEFRQYDLPTSLDELHDLGRFDHDNIDPDGKFRWKGRQPIVCFGDVWGDTFDEVLDKNPGLLSWVINKNKFSPEARAIAANALKGIYPVPPPPAAATTTPTEDIKPEGDAS